MRVIQYYYFHTNKIVPFSELPERIHQFLNERNLVNDRFFYCFDEMEGISWYYEHGHCSKSCQQAVKDCPALGEIRHIKDGYDDYYQLSNIARPTDCTEADILPIMNKIHRRYGFQYSNLYYYDINFFGEVIRPVTRNLDYVRKLCKRRGLPYEEDRFLKDQLLGSGISIERSFDGKCVLTMSVDVLRDGKVLDATPYYEAMKKVLPRVRSSAHLDVLLPEEDIQRIAEKGRAGSAILEECRAFLEEHMPDDSDQRCPFAEYSVAPAIKKLAKQYGYKYSGLGAGCSFLNKRTGQGQNLRLMVDSPPSHSEIGFYLEYNGMGFSHRLCTWVLSPSNQEELNACAQEVMGSIAEFEEKMLPKLETVYDPTPEWYTYK